MTVRANLLATDRDGLAAALDAEGQTTEPGRWSATALHVTSRTNLFGLRAFKEGLFEAQDEGSQLLGFLVAPTRHDLVVDFCAGSGGKSLMLGALMRSHGRIYAFDVSTARLNRLKPRLKRSGLSNIHPQAIRNENDIRVKRLGGKVDRVLVDAPCSGLGTLRRNPDLKWRQSPQSVAELKLKQAAILRAAARIFSDCWGARTPIRRLSSASSWPSNTR